MNIQTNDVRLNLLYKCPELKSNDFKPQEERGREREIERKKEMTELITTWAKTKI
jgi:hypothetical protein